MKFLKISSFAFCFCCLFGFSTYGTSHANYVVTVKVEQVLMTASASTTTTGAGVNLRNTTGGAIGTWAPNAVRRFYLYKPLGDQGLAILLTAISTGTKVLVNIVDVTDGSLIMYLAATQVAQ